MHANRSANVSSNKWAQGGAPRWLVLGVSFFGGFQIMALEMCGFRVLQTNLGSSVIVTGTLLTVLMLLLALGYYTGGRLSARTHTARSLFVLLAFGAVYTVISTALLEPIAALGGALREALERHIYLRTAVPAALLTLLLYGPPVFVMSMISPYWIRLQARAGATPGADSGVQSGFFMSLSTLGSIAGTMLASYVLIPAAGVAVTANATALTFFALTLVGYVKTTPSSPRRATLRAIGLGVAALAVATIGLLSSGGDANVVYAAESLYGQIRIERSEDPAGRPLLEYYPSRVYTHSVLYPDEPLRDLEGLMYLVPGLVRAPRSVLVLGSAVGGVLRSIELAFPEARTVGVDLDPAVHQAALSVFGVDPSRSTLVTADARVFLAEHRERYDLIIVDLFAGEFIPTHCISREFFELVRARLAPGGGVFVNTNMNDVPYELPADAEPFRAPRHLAATLRAAGLRGLFENSFFHSLFAFDEELSIDALRGRLVGRLGQPGLHDALRAAAGIAAFTTVAVPSQRRPYRPFSDDWTPALAIELKSNARAIYDALGEHVNGATHGVPWAPEARVASIVLKERLADRASAEEPGVRDLDRLIRALNRVGSASDRAAIDIAAKHFRFDEAPRDGGSPTRTRWAALARLYAELQRFGHENDYEALLPVLARLTEYL